MPQPDDVMALPVPDPASLDEDLQRYFAKCQEKLGLVPNVLRAYAFRPEKLRAFIQMYNELMLGDSCLSKLEREMIAVVVSSANRCYYCLVAHGQAVRQLADDPELGEMLVMDHRVAELSPRQRAMLEFVWKLTLRPHEVGAGDRAALYDAGFGEEEIFDIINVAGFFNLSNRVAAAADMMPNRDDHAMNRAPAGAAGDGNGG